MNTCKVDGCNNKHSAKGYCKKHYTQMKRYGKILNRTIKDPNEIIIYEDYAEIVLYNRKCEEIGRALIDVDDVNKVKQYKWSLCKGYVNSYPNIKLHRLILNYDGDMDIDHINRNPLDNRKSNLRICTHNKNMRNKSKQSNNSSGETGVYWSNEKEKWYSQITINGETINLGYFNNKEDAIKSRRKAEIRYFNDYNPNK